MFIDQGRVDRVKNDRVRIDRIRIDRIGIDSGWNRFGLEFNGLELSVSLKLIMTLI